VNERIARLKLLIVVKGSKAKSDIFHEGDTTNKTGFFVYPRWLFREPYPEVRGHVCLHDHTDTLS